MEAAQDEHKAVALLQAVLRRDEAAVHAALASGAPLKLDGLTALHAAALADWGSGVPLLLAAGAELDACTDFGHSDEVESAKLSSLAQLGLAAGQVAALGKWFYRRTPLEVAVAAGAAAAAEALLSAGASSAVFETLLDLAKRTAVQPGATAAAAVQEAVQRMAGVLLAHGLLPGAAASGAHKTAVKLAYPKPPPGGGDGQPLPPPCDWMLQRLLQMHSSGQLGDAHAPAVEEAVRALSEHAAAEHGVEAAVAQWLSVPAAAAIEARRVQLLGCLLLERGIAGEALAALLALPAAQQALAERSTERLSDWLNVRHQSSLVASAAASERAAALDAVLAAGGTVTLNDVNQFSTMHWRSPRGLALLLSRGVPPVPADVPAGQVVWWSACPIYALLEGFCNEWELVVEDECMKLDYGPAGVGPSEDGLQKLHADALALMDELAAAGYRPVTFRNYLEHYGPDARVLPTFYPPSDARREAAQWELATTSKWLWLAAQREPWSPATHARFPPAFRAAARALLLVARRGSTSPVTQQRRPGLRPRRQAQTTTQEAPSASAAGLASLPPELLHRVLRLAAYPLSTWRPRIQEGRMFDEIQEIMHSLHAYW